MKTNALEIQRSLARRLRTFSSSSSVKQNTTSVTQLFGVLHDYDCLAGELYRLRASVPRTDRQRAQLEEFMSEVSQELLTVRAEQGEERAYQTWVQRYRMIWRREVSLFLFTLCLFAGSTLLGWNVVVRDPQMVPVLISQHFMETIIDQQPWFQEIRTNPYLYGFKIAWNNIQVSITCFTLGALLGIGGLYVLCYNGVFFGAIMGYCYMNGFHKELTDFVIGHGPLELTIIIASAFASMLYGRTFFMRPLREFPARFARGAKDAVSVIVGVLPWLVLAACLEVFVSPFDYLGFEAKLLLGSVCTVLFWLWTFWPENTEEKLIHT